MLIVPSTAEPAEPGMIFTTDRGVGVGVGVGEFGGHKTDSGSVTNPGSVTNSGSVTDHGSMTNPPWIQDQPWMFWILDISSEISFICIYYYVFNCQHMHMCGRRCFIEIGPYFRKHQIVLYREKPALNSICYRGGLLVLLITIHSLVYFTTEVC